MEIKEFIKEYRITIIVGILFVALTELLFFGFQ